jgi:hypothetical protein
MVLRAGAPGVGEVVQASRHGLGGKPAKLVLAARYLTVGGRRVPLRGLRLAAAGHNNANAAGVVGLTGIAFAPLGFAGLAVRGGNVEFPAGLRAAASIAKDTHLSSLGPAPPGVRSASPNASTANENGPDAGPIAIPRPPAGKGQVVFFRKRTLLGTAQWFKVRENGAELGKLSNGAYFVHVTSPGTHTYTATFEPELKDHLTLEVGPGDTYFVEGTISKALVMGAADLSPSDRATFEKDAPHLKPAHLVSEERERKDAEKGDKAANRAE